ncbi:MAG TPA: dihydroorotase [Baekduia sp.]|nr:dihydroorotase [Baekduia sp.]
MPQLLASTQSKPASVLITGARVLDPREGIDAGHDVLVLDGEIAEIGAPGSIDHDGAERIDASGKLLVPAFVDPHVHFRTPGQEHKETIATGTASAAAGGYCAVLAMPNTTPVLDSAPLLRSLFEEAARSARIPLGFVPAITRGMNGQELTEMAELRDAGAAGFTDDGRPVESAGMLRKALQYQRLCGGTLALHEEDPTLSAGGSMNEGKVSAVLGVGGIPSISESTMIARDALIAEYEEGRIHIQHVSARASVDAIADARSRGVEITGEASPHHLCLTDESVRGLDTSRKMNPPLRTEDDRQAIISGLKDGTLGCIATDHAPHARSEKEVPFEQAPMGTTGLETAFSSIYTELVKPGVIGLDLLVRRLSDGAAMFELQTPRIATGAAANLTLIDLEREWVVGEHGYASRSDNCCFDGMTFSGTIDLTIAAGGVVHRARATEGAAA